MITKSKLDDGFVAGQDFTAAHQYCGVNIDSTDTLDSAIAVELAGTGEAIAGFLQEYDTTGKPVRVVTTGFTKAKAGAAIAVNARLKMDSSGRVVTTTTAGDEVVATAMTAAAAADEYLLVKISDFRY